MRIERWVLLAALLCLAQACRHYTAVQPEGFAAFKTGGDFRAASADGVLFRVRQEDNRDETELVFWKEALKHRMIDAGYTFLRENDVQAQNAHPGYLLELTAPVGPVDYAYLVSIFVSGKHIVIAEAAGDVVKLDVRKPQIMDALAKLQID